MDKLFASLGNDPVRLVRALGHSGFLGTAVGAVRLKILCRTREDLAYHSGLADGLLAVQGLAAHPIRLAGTDAQKKQWLLPLKQGQKIGAFALTEPEAGSDISAINTSARKVRGNTYSLSGVKWLVSNAGVADVYTIFARTKKGLTAFAVPSRGIRVSETESLSPLPLGTIMLKNVEGERIGAEGSGWDLAQRTLNVFRTSVGAAACGMARRAMGEAMTHLRKRKQFGRPLSDFQALRFQLADMATDLEAARGLVERAARAHDTKKGDFPVLSAMAKLFATEAAQRVVDACVQIHGGQGVLKDSVPERLYREVRGLRITEGTSEIMKHLIAGRLLPEGRQVALP